ncbi:MAG TPA: radical SAM family heme chaperone HemW [Planctomycetota bacterium]|nr:radical SAM family heme chaperone HemW [Planctomycetota bacterium]HPY75204.1 radical SAM family heme chaperone HemW [Planctomycetota bacterium]HQB00486.1 radical SAM family heme chaperone HemW [Planctomycetota bacterium]
MLQNFPGIYIHVPFCLKKCAYCAFYSLENFSKYNEYCKAIQRDIDFICHFAYDTKPDTLYWGGGTPSLLKEHELATWMQQLTNTFTFQEVTMEVNPSSMTQEKCKFYRSIGIQRISIGIQSLDDQVLQFLGRLHTAKQAKQVIQQVQSTFENFSLDLIYAIPQVSSQIIYTTLQQMVENFQPPHISTYPLEIYSHTLLGKKNLQSSEEQFSKEYEWIHQYLQSQGYIHYEVSNFCKKDFQALHNSKYWKCIPYWGLGPSAHSLWNHRRFSYKDIQHYIEQDLQNLYENALPLSPQDMHEEQIMLAARTLQGIPRFQCSITDERLQFLIKQNLLSLENQQIYIQPQGWQVLNSLIVELL